MKPEHRRTPDENDAFSRFGKRYLRRGRGFTKTVKANSARRGRRRSRQEIRKEME